MKEFTSRIINEHKTNDPYVIAKNLNIKVIEEPLGKINGYYDGFIHVNSELPKWHRHHVVAYHLFDALNAHHASFLVYKESLDEHDLCKLQNVFSAYLTSGSVHTLDEFKELVAEFEIPDDVVVLLFARLQYIKSLGIKKEH